MKYIVETQDCSYQIQIEHDGEIIVDGKTHTVDLRSIDNEVLYSLIVDGQSYEVFVDWSEGTFYVMLEGERHAIRVEDERVRMLTRLGGKAQPKPDEVLVKAPMPGLVVKILADAGTEVKTGDALLILEAMKMENEIRAPQPGTIKAIRITPGRKVEKDEVLAVIA